MKQNTKTTKSDSNIKRKAVIIALTLLVIVGGGVIVYIIANEKGGVLNPGAQYGTSADGFSTNVDKDKHIGVIDAVTTNQIKEGFGGEVQVADMKQSGTVRLGETHSETVSTTVSSDAGAVSFDVDARMYKSAGDLRRANVFAGAEEEKVADLGQEAHYLFPFGQEYAKEQQSILLVRQGKVSYRFAITQQSDAIVYDEAKAREILLEIAKNANLESVK